MEKDNKKRLMLLKEVLDEGHFIATAEVSLSPNFYGWLFGFGDKIRLVSPAGAVEEYRSRLEAELEITQQL